MGISVWRPGLHSSTLYLRTKSCPLLQKKKARRTTVAFKSPFLVVGASLLAISPFAVHGDGVDWASRPAGARGKLPAFGKMTFSLGSCDLGDDGDSFVYIIMDGETFQTFSEYWNDRRTCDGNFNYVHYEKSLTRSNSLMSIQVNSYDNHCTCGGTFLASFGDDTTRDKLEDCFSMAHVLCNDGFLVSIVSQSAKDPATYSLFYALDATDAISEMGATNSDDLNERSGFNRMSQDFMQVPDGKYCGLNLFDTMTLLQSDLKQGSAFDWTCKANEPNEMGCETKTSCHDGPDPSPTTPTSTPFTDSDQNEPITKPTPDTDTCAGPRPTYCRAFGRESCESDVGCYWHYGGFCVDGFCS